MLNRSIIMGRLVRDPELRHTPSDVAVTTFTLAVDRSYSRAGAERETDFIDVVAWRQTAEFVCKYFSKGRMAVVDGRLQARNYEDKQGNKRKAVEIVADNVYFGDSKRDSDNSGYQQGGYSAPYGVPTAPPPTNGNYAGYGSASAPATPQPGYPASDFEEIVGADDDLPF